LAIFQARKLFAHALNLGWVYASDGISVAVIDFCEHSSPRIDDY
jgi:hypothetical protein